MRHPALCALLLVAACLAPLGSGVAEARAENLYTPASPHRDGIGKAYMGRPIAAIMGWQAAGWLERPERAREEDSRRLVEGLNLQPGQVVADIGAGSGYYARRFATQVGARGTVYAVDVQPQMLALLEALARQPEYANLRPVLGAVDDVRLPPASIDVAVMVDVYHELEFPFEVLASLLRALKPDGRIVFVEYKAEDASVPIKPLHKMSVRQIVREAQVHGLVMVDSIRGLPWQHALVFARDPARR